MPCTRGCTSSCATWLTVGFSRVAMSSFAIKWSNALGILVSWKGFTRIPNLLWTLFCYKEKPSKVHNGKHQVFLVHFTTNKNHRLARRHRTPHKYRSSSPRNSCPRHKSLEICFFCGEEGQNTTGLVLLGLTGYLVLTRSIRPLDVSM